MERIIYVAGVNRKHLAAATAEVPYWLLSATLLRKYPSWLESYMTKDRQIRWDPGTYSDDPISYQYYRKYLYLNAKPHHTYLQYDEIGDEEATAWYLRDMRRRGMSPIPVLQGRMFYLLRQEPIVAIGGLVPMNDDTRRRYLDEIFYDHRPVGKVHLLGMIKKEWYAPYGEATDGDNSSWIPRDEWARKKSIDEWMQEYGEQWIPHVPRQFIQMSLAI